MSTVTNGKRVILVLFLLGSWLLIFYPAGLSFFDNKTALQGHTCKSLHQMQKIHDGSMWQAKRSHKFFAFDWIVRPDVHMLANLDVHDLDLCVTGDESCNVNYHQTAHFCPDPNEKLTNWTRRIASESAKTGLDAQLVSADSKNGIQSVNREFKYFNKHTTLGSCQRTRVTPSFVVPNDASAWGLLSTHEPAHLIVFIGAIFSVAALTELVMLEMMMHDENQEKSTFHMYLTSGLVEGYAIVLILLLFVFRMITPTVTTLAGAHYVRALANSSFLYGVFHYVLWCFYCSYRLRDFKHHKKGYHNDNDQQEMQQIALTQNDKLPPSHGMHANPLHDYAEAKAPEWNLGAFTSKVPVKTAGLQDVTRLVTTPAHLNRGLFLFHMPVPPAWAALQVVVLPLWILAVWTGTRGYSLDVNIQALYTLTLIFGLLDAYGEPVMTSLRAIEQYWDNENNMKTMEHTQRKIFEFGPLSLVYFIIFLLQVLVIVGIWHIFDISNIYYNITGDENNYRQFFSAGFGFYPLMIYFALLTVGKAYKYYKYDMESHRIKEKQKTKSEKNNMAFFQSTGDTILFIFVFTVYLYCLVYLANTHNHANLLIGSLQVGSSKHTEISENLRSIVVQWSNTWQPPV